MEKKVTLKQIAELAEVSIGTVDRALNNRGRINTETKDKILKIADELHYKPNLLASSLSKKKRIHIGIVMASQPEEFCKYLIKGVEKAKNEVLDYGVTSEFIMTESLSGKVQLEALKKINLDDFDGFLLNAGSDELKNWINDTVAIGKTVMTFNSDIKTSNRICYVGEDPFRAGLLMGNLINEIAPDVGTIGLLLGFQDNYSHYQRCRGIKQAVTQVYPDTRFIELQYYDSSDIAEEKTRELLKIDPQIQVLFAASGTGVWGIGQAIESIEKEKRPKVFGYDVSKHVEILMKKDLCQAVIFQDPYWQGYYGMKILIDHFILKKKIKRKQYIIRSKLVLKNNICDYLRDKYENDVFLL